VIRSFDYKGHLVQLEQCSSYWNVYIDGKPRASIGQYADGIVRKAAVRYAKLLIEKEAE
jgi:hypothetical protein